jgi:release factor glutamine methyltransferase
LLKRSTDQIWTVLDLIKWGTEYFKGHDVDAPRLTMELLLCHVLDSTRIKLYADFDRPLTKAELAVLRPLVQRRAHGEPLQYILGEADFYSLRFEVGPDVLIPRPETELLVEQAIEYIQSRKGSVRGLDIGTGSGIIPISIAYHTSSTWLAIDVSKGALATAERNATRHGVAERCHFDLLDFLREAPSETFDVITMNPPYIPAKDVADLQREVRDYEPHAALTDDADGLTFYKRLFELAPDLMNTGGIIIAELGWGSANHILTMVPPQSSADVIDDLAGIPRVLRVAWST